MKHAMEKDQHKLKQFRQIKQAIDAGKLLGPFDIDWIEQNRAWLIKMSTEWSAINKPAETFIGKT